MQSFHFTCFKFNIVHGSLKIRSSGSLFYAISGSFGGSLSFKSNTYKKCFFLKKDVKTENLTNPFFCDILVKKGVLSMELEDFFKTFDLQLYFLHTTLKIKEHPKEVQKILKFLYGSVDQNLKNRMGTIMNAIFTQNLQTFLLSKRTLYKLFLADSESKYKSLSSREYSLLLARLTNSGLFETLRYPTINQAGVYKLINPEMVAIIESNIGRKLLALQEKNVVDFYDMKNVIVDDKKSGDEEFLKLSREERARVCSERLAKRIKESKK